MKKVVKFGGSSLANAEQFQKVGDIIRSEESRRYVVPSAPGKRFSADTKVTDLLYACYDKAEAGEDFSDILTEIKSRFYEIIKGLNLDLSLEEEFRQMGNRKILFNTGLSPAWDEAAFTEWLDGDDLCVWVSIGAVGSEQLLNHPHVRCMQVSTGRTRQAFDRLSAKVLANLSEYNG